MSNGASPLTTKDFQGGQREINLGGFTNLEKGLSWMDVLEKYGNGDHLILNRDHVSELLKGIVAQSDTLEKAGGTTKTEQLEKAKSSLKLLQPIDVITEKGVQRFWILEKAKVATDALEKGAFSEALGYGGVNKIEFPKTGKEIKEKLTTINTTMTTTLQGCKARMAVILEKVGFLPTELLDEYELRGVPEELRVVKRFPWARTYWDGGTSSHMAIEPVKGNVGSEQKSATSEEEANLCREYNTLVRQCCDCASDLKKMNTFVANLDDKKVYKLDLNQLTALGF